MSIDMYEEIPVMGSGKFLLREVEDTDTEKEYQSKYYVREV